VTPLDPGAKRKPAVDETGFQQVLAAAYVLQQYNDSLRAQDPRMDSGWVLTQVAETRSLLRAGAMDLKAAAKLIADRLQTMTDAAGVSISLTFDGYLNCIAESGAAAEVPGRSIASHSLVATERLKNGRVFQSADAQKDIRLDDTTCREFGVRALLAVPVQRLGQVAGLVEVRWGKPDAFLECDLRTCQLMATLVTEVLDRREESRVSFAATSQVSPEQPPSESEANEELVSKVPNADGGAVVLAEERVAEDAPSNLPPDSSSDPERSAEVLAVQCRVCGRRFRADETFCGNCSMPRAAGAASEDLQSKWASLWYMQQAQGVLEEREEPPQSPLGAAHIEPQSLENVARHDEIKEAMPESVWRRPERSVDSARPEDESASTVPSVQDSIAPTSWDDAIRTAWGHAQHTVRLRIGRKAALAMMASLAVLLLLVIWAGTAPASPHLTWFESVLVELGLAQVPSRAPTAPAGNPEVRVWVDVHTALYYCPGSDLYGKTPGGQFATQHDAQQDQFEPATSAVCE
jgi:GAF domain